MSASVLSHALLETIAQSVASHAASADLLARLRADYPGLYFNQCCDDDIPARLQPVRAAEGFDLYLLDTREHCSSLTADIDTASGVVIAWHSDGNDET